MTQGPCGLDKLQQSREYQELISCSKDFLVCYLLEEGYLSAPLEWYRAKHSHLKAQQKLCRIEEELEKGREAANLAGLQACQRLRKRREQALRQDKAALNRMEELLKAEEPPEAKGWRRKNAR